MNHKSTKLDKAIGDLLDSAGLMNARIQSAGDFLGSPVSATPGSSPVSWSGMQSIRYDWPKWETLANPDAPRFPLRRLTFHNQVVTIHSADADKYASQWIDYILKPKPSNIAAVEASIAVLYNALRLKQPRIHWFDNPFDCLKAVGNIVTPRVLIDNLPNGSEFSPLVRTYANAVHAALSQNRSINFRAEHAITPQTLNRVILYDMAREFGLDVPDRYKALVTLVANVGLCVPLENDVYVCKAPVEVRFDNRQRLHHDTRPAIEYPDGSGFCYWHNVLVPSHVICAPETISLEEIENEQNAEVRRVMIEKYGAAKWITDTGAEEVASDEFGAILVKNMGRIEEPIVVIRVRNSTPEGLYLPTGQFEELVQEVDGEEVTYRRPIMQFVPELRDGEPYYKDYYLRVDPNAYGGKTREIPQAAVASTWRDSQGNLLFPDYRDYTLEKQT